MQRRQIAARKKELVVYMGNIRTLRDLCQIQGGDLQLEAEKHRKASRRNTAEKEEHLEELKKDKINFMQNIKSELEKVSNTINTALQSYEEIEQTTDGLNSVFGDMRAALGKHQSEFKTEIERYKLVLKEFEDKALDYEKLAEEKDRESQEMLAQAKRYDSQLQLIWRWYQEAEHLARNPL